MHLETTHILVTQEELKLRADLSAAKGEIEGMKIGIEYLKAEIKRLQERCDSLLVAASNRKKK